ncbi:hypothetical protein [Brassicibacter mesophilus]|uniref:hypothetical protein n=1 Tax=Brassicibacter mesophilus TaxID=745119 RepID=UPI003D251A34
MENMNIEKLDFQDLLDNQNKVEGLVMLGAGGNLNDWLNGLKDMLVEEDHVIVKDTNNTFWKKAYELTTTGGRTDLVLIFNDKNQVNWGSLALWRLRFGNCSWLSDYIINYQERHQE